MLKRLKSWLKSHKLTAKKRRHHKRWELLMRGGVMRDTKTEKEYTTSAMVTDDGVIVDHMAGRRFGGECVEPMFVRPFGLKEDKFWNLKSTRQ